MYDADEDRRLFGRRHGDRRLLDMHAAERIAGERRIHERRLHERRLRGEWEKLKEQCNACGQIECQCR